MSVIFFEVDELANVGTVMAWTLYGGTSQKAANAAEWVAAYSVVNARAYSVRYGKKTDPVSTVDLEKAINAKLQKGDKGAAWSTASLFRYNAAEADPTARELNTICAIVEAVGRALFTK